MAPTTERLLALEEGFSEKPYYCINGYPTVGIGKRIGPKGADLSLYEFTVSKQMAYLWLGEEIVSITDKLINHDWYVALDAARQDIVISMCYQLGYSGFMQFKNTIRLIADGNYRDASVEMLDSLWASEKQTPERAMRHSQVMRFGYWSAVDEYKSINIS